MKNKLLDIGLDLVTPVMDYIYSLLEDDNIPENVKVKTKEFLKEYENKIMNKLKGQ